MLDTISSIYCTYTTSAKRLKQSTDGEGTPQVWITLEAFDIGDSFRGKHTGGIQIFVSLCRRRHLLQRKQTLRYEF